MDCATGVHMTRSGGYINRSDKRSDKTCAMLVLH